MPLIKFISLNYSFLFLTAIITNFTFAAGEEAITKEKASQWLRKQPVQFLENKGQMADMNHEPVPFVLFKAEAPGVDMYITEKGLTYVFIKSEKIDKNHQKDKEKDDFEKDENIQIEWNRVDLNLKGATIKKENIIKENPSLTNYNYFLGHCPNGIYGAKKYEKITIKEIYPGIDWVLYNSSNKGFKYDFIVHPAANPDLIELVYSSLMPLSLKKDGSINIETELGSLTENTPYSYIRESKREIKTKFKIVEQKHTDKQYYETILNFELLKFEPSNFQTLIIDPQLTWTTFLGGSGIDGPESLDIDSFNNLFITGYSYSSNFPTQNAGTFFQGINANDSDIFISKFNNAGVLLWTTYYGGSSFDLAFFLTIDNNNNIFITGGTGSFDFPVQNAGTFFQGIYAGGGNVFSAGDGFIVKFDNMGNRLWATYYGGSSDDIFYSMAVSNNGDIFLTGWTLSSNLPVQNAGTFFQATNAGDWDAFIVKFDNLGNRLWATYYGGSGMERCFQIKVDNIGNVFVGGNTNSSNFPLQNVGTFFQGIYGGGPDDSFFLKFDNLGNRLWSTYYGGSSNDSGFMSMQVDANNNIFVYGETRSINFPLQNSGTFFQGTIGGDFDAYILKFDNLGNRLWATYLGGSGNENLASVDDIAIDHCGNVYVSFETGSTDMIIQTACDSEYQDNTFNGGFLDIYLTKFSNTGELLWATYFGGSEYDRRGPLAIDKNDNLFMAISWSQGGAVGTITPPLINPGAGAYYDPTFNGMGDCFIAKFNKTIPVISTSIMNSGCNCTGNAIINVSCSNTYNYIWSNGSQTLNTTNSSDTVTGLCTGTYTVTVYANCDTLQTTVTISDGSGSMILDSIQNNVLCYSDSNGTATIIPLGGTPPYSYNWYPLVSTASTVSNLSAGNYIVAVVDSMNCIDSVEFIITEPPPIGADIHGNDTICIGESSTLNANGNGTFTWSTGSTNQNITVGPTNDTIYSLIVSNGPCSDTASVNIIVNEIPLVTISNDTTLFLGTSAQLIASGGTMYNWYPSTGLSCSDCPNPIAKPTETVTYCVIVTDENGCIDSSCMEIIVDKEYTFYIPNAFTPENNNLNDIFKPELKGIHNYRFLIFNRWGENIFETTNLYEGWNGYYKGLLCEQGVFIYKIAFIDDKNNQLHQYIGKVTLVR